jgi:hypothetical protein
MLREEDEGGTAAGFGVGSGIRGIRASTKTFLETFLACDFLGEFSRRHNSKKG